VVTVSPSLTGKRIEYNKTHLVYENYGMLAVMIVHKNLTINGNGIILDGLGVCRFFQFRGGWTITLNDIVFHRGYSSNNDGRGGAGGAINHDNVTVYYNNCYFLLN